MTRQSATSTAHALPDAQHGLLQRACACGQHTGGGECESCKKKQGQLQRAALSPVTPQVAPPIVHDVLHTSGQPLDAGARAALEPRFGQDFSQVPAHSSGATPGELTIGPAHDPFEQAAETMAQRVMRQPAPSNGAAYDFSGVRVHTDSRAAESAQAVGARAYTVGNHIVFGAGQYAPGTNAGRRLLAHELTHVAQQGNGLQRQLQRQPLAGCAQLLATHQMGGLGGTLVHQLIEAPFLATVPGALRVGIPGAYAGPLRTQGLCGADKPAIDPQQIGGRSARAGVGIPDLARLTPGGILQVAEIKPAATPCLVDGEEQLLRYIEQGNAQDPAQVAWRNALGIRVVAPMLPGAYQPPNLASGPCQIQTAWCTPGLMAYAVRCGAVVPPQPQEQEQEQEQTAEEPMFRLPRGPIWDKVYAAIAVLGALAAAYSLWGKVGALLGLLLRALGFGLGLAAGAAAAAAGTTRVPGGPPIVQPVPGGMSGSSGARERKKAPGSGTAAPKPAARTPAIPVHVIEGINAERVAVGMVFPVQFHAEGRKPGEELQGVAILQVTRVIKEQQSTTVEFVSLQERMNDRKAGGSAGQTSLGGQQTYVLTHPYRGSEPEQPGLVGYVINTGPNRQWFWTYLDNLANELEAAGQKSLAGRVRQEAQRLRQQAAGPHP